MQPKLEAQDIRLEYFQPRTNTRLLALGRITADEVLALSQQTMGQDCDALFIGCSQLPTYAILGKLERAFKRPAWSSIKATAWDAARLPANA